MILTGIEWGSVADWIAAIGTVGAVAFALCTRKQRGIINAKVYCELIQYPMLVDDPSGVPGKSIHAKKITHFKIILSNLGNANLLVTEMNVKIADQTNFNLALMRPEMIESENVRIIDYVGYGLLASEINSENHFNTFDATVFEYIKSNKTEIELITQNGKKTKWPIQINLKS